MQSFVELYNLGVLSHWLQVVFNYKESHITVTKDPNSARFYLKCCSLYIPHL
jgi:hypothetical protein